MTDQEKWQLAISALTGEFAALAEEDRRWLANQAELCKGLKKAMVRLSDEAGGSGICAACRGECCLTGKYHVTVVDILVLLVSGEELFTPRFGAGHCPYLGEKGCLLAAAYRPSNCVSFNCQRIEALQEPVIANEFTRLEGELRDSFIAFERRFGNRFANGLLMNFERDILVGRGRLLKTVAGQGQ